MNEIIPGLWTPGAAHPVAPLQTPLTNNDLVAGFAGKADAEDELAEIEPRLKTLRAKLAEVPTPPPLQVSAMPAADALEATARRVELNRLIGDLQDRSESLRAIMRVGAVHLGVALAMDEAPGGDIYVYAAGSDTSQEGRRGLLFKDDRPGGGWSVRLKFRPDVRVSQRGRDPGTYDRPTLAECMSVARDWVVSGVAPDV